MLSMWDRVFHEWENTEDCDCLELFTTVDEECSDGWWINEFTKKEFNAYITHKYNKFLDAWCLNLSIYGTWFDRVYVDVLQLDSEYDKEAGLPHVTEVKSPDCEVLRVCAWTYPPVYGNIRTTWFAYAWFLGGEKKVQKTI